MLFTIQIKIKKFLLKKINTKNIIIYLLLILIKIFVNLVNLN